MPRGAPILVVDDDEVARRALCRALTATDLECVECGSGGEALRSLTVQPLPALILLDLVMPDPDGYDVLRMLRSRPWLRDVPVVVMTGLESDDDATRAFALGAEDFVRKPINPRELIARIRGQLRMREYVDTLARRERDAQAVLEITRALSSSLEMREILFTLVRRVADLVHVERCSIVLVRDDHDVGYVVAASDDEHLRDLPIDLTQYPEIREVLVSGEPLVIRDTQTHPLFDVVRKGLPLIGFSSLGLVPIVLENRPMGVIFLRARHTLALGDHEVSLLRTIANATAIALRNAKILKSLRETTQQMKNARFEAERRLRVLQRYADFFENAADGSLVVDTGGTILLSNPQARAFTGYSDEELTGRNLGSLLGESERERFTWLLRQFEQGVYPRGVDLRMAHRSGSPITLSVNTSSVLRDENAILFMFRDVTQERATAAELTRTKEFLERVIDNSVDAIIASNMEGTVLIFNRAAQRCYGYRADEVIGRMQIDDLYPPGVADEIMRLTRSNEHGGLGRLEDYRCEMIDRDGCRVPVTLSVALIYQEGEPVACVGLFTDLRERLRMQQRLEAAQDELRAREKQAAIAELAGAAAHELNQPLTSVMGYAQLLKRRLESDASAQGVAEIILNESERMAEIVRKIGKITKYETKTYVGGAKILDLDKASGTGSDPPGGTGLPA